MKERDERRIFSSIFEKQELTAAAKLTWHFAWRKAGGVGREVTFSEDDVARWINFCRESTSGSIDILIDQFLGPVGELPKLNREQLPILLKVIDGLLADFSTGRSTDEASARALAASLPLMSKQQRDLFTRLFRPEGES